MHYFCPIVEIHSKAKDETSWGQINPLLSREVISTEQIYLHLTC